MIREFFPLLLPGEPRKEVKFVVWMLWNSMAAAEGAGIFVTIHLVFLECAVSLVYNWYMMYGGLAVLGVFLMCCGCNLC